MTTLSKRPNPIVPKLSIINLINQLQPSPEVLIFLSALFIGIGSGASLILFRKLIDLCQDLSFNHLMGFLSLWGNWTLIFIPILGGALVGLLRWLFPKILGQSDLTIISEPRIQNISPLRPFLKMLAAAISLGTGASLGPEGPSVEIGSCTGVLLGQLFQVSKERYRLLLAAGAAAGIAAGFNAPIAGVFFALEVVLSATFTNSVVSLIVLSAVISALIANVFLEGHSFSLPTYQVLSYWEWFYYFGLGLLASLVSLLFTQTIKLGQVVFSRLSQIPRYLHPILGGGLIGLLALGLPQILGIGYGTLEVILSGERFPLFLLFLMLVVKLVATAISLGSGLVGGIFAPAMFLGACLGAIYGHLLSLLPFGIPIAPPAAYAMVGMAAVLATSAKAPLTGIILLFELTQNYLIILPLMAAVGVSVWLNEVLMNQQSFTGLTWQQMGINLTQPNEIKLLQQIPVMEVMEKNFLTFSTSFSLLKAGATMLESKCHTALVLDNYENLVGIVTLNDLRQKIIQAVNQGTQKELLNLNITEICTGEVIYAYADESVLEARKKMDFRGLYLLPVVNRDNSRQVIGIINRSCLALAEDLGVINKIFTANFASYAE